MFTATKGITTALLTTVFLLVPFVTNAKSLGSAGSEEALLKGEIISVASNTEGDYTYFTLRYRRGIVVCWVAYPHLADRVQPIIACYDRD